MVKQEDFHIERWMDEYENNVELNISETCCHSLSLDQVSDIIGKPVPVKEITSSRLVYGAIPGSQQLRQNIASMYNETSFNAGPEAINVDKSNVLITNGAIGANFLLYYGLVGPGDNVVVVDPVYQQLKSVPAMFGAEVTLLPLKPENGYLPTIEDLNKAVFEAKNPTKLIIINSPHNPTGSIIPTELLHEIVAVARKAGAYIKCDEVYRPMYFQDPKDLPPSIVSIYDKGISTGSTSKAFGLAGLRLGWIVATDKSVIQECLSRRDYNTISVGLIDDIIATWALGDYQKIVAYNTEVCKRTLSFLDTFVTTSNGAVSYVKPQGGTTTFLQIHGLPDNNTINFCKAIIAEKSTLIVPGETFGKPGFIRVGFGNEPDNFVTGLNRMKDYLIEAKYVASPWGAN